MVPTIYVDIIVDISRTGKLFNLQEHKFMENLSSLEHSLTRINKAAWWNEEINQLSLWITPNG